VLGASRQRLRHAVGAGAGRTGQLQPTVPAPERLPRPRWFVWFTPALGLLLGGYLFFSKSFAYLHVPGTPVFVGEIVLAIGMFEALQLPSPWRHLLSRAPVLKVVLVFLAICGVRLFFDYPAYGLDAARDAAIAYYGLFALLTAAAAVCEPTFVPRLLGWYRRVLPAFLVWAPVAILLSDVDALAGIVVPGTDTPINSFKVGDFGVQIAMAVAFLWLDGTQAGSGPTRRSPSRTTTLSLVGLVGLFVCLTQNRGGFLAGAVTLFVAAVYLPPGRRRRLALPLVSGLAVVTLFIALLNVRIPISEREISLQQVTSNITSIVHRQSSQQLRGTVEWREQLWQRLRADMLATGAWRTGLGFGPVLGTRYGVSDPSDPRPLRNIHNSHLTVFARTGAVGLAVWTLLWLIWCVYLHRWIRRRPGGVRDPRGATAGWLLAGAVGLLVNAYFDPSLEGPQACIWLYVILGIGAATTRSPRSPRQPALASAGPAGERSSAGAGPDPWRAATERTNATERANGRPADPAERDAPAAGAERWSIARLAEQGRRLQGVARRLGWAVADQALSSLTNFLVGFFVARSLGPTAFGAFSVAFATYLIALNGSRGLATDPLMVRYSGVQLAEWRRAVAGSTGTAAAVGTLGGIVCAALAIVVPGPTGLALVALGLSMPGLLLQDSWRFAFFSAGTAGRAFANDLIRAVVLLILIAAVIASGRSSEFFFMLAWGISATIAAVAGAVQARLLPRALLAADWLRRHRDLCSRYLAENLSVTGGTQLKFYGLAAVGGIAVVGTLRAAELLFGGVYVLTQGIGLMAVPEAVRLLRQSRARLRQFCLLISALGGGGGIVCGAVLLAIPESLGQRLLHESWAPASTVLLPTTVFITAFGLQMGAWAGLRALAAASRSLLSQLVGSVLSVAGVLAGAAAAGAIGAAWGIAAAGVLAATFWWWQFHVGLHRFREAEPET
jgi:O-antigen/teichoic acid export membrane protein